MCRIIIPVSLAVALLQWSGWLDTADVVLDPLMRLLNLPSEAALPIITGMLINIYAAIAIMTVLPFSIAQLTLIAVFTLIAHNLITEGIIQFRSGINIIKITLVRIGIAIITVLVVSQFFSDTAQSISIPASQITQAPLIEALGAWFHSLWTLLVKILLIIMAIMIVMESLEQLGWTEHLFNFFRPFMKALGLSNRATVLWVAAVIFGLMYGSAVIRERISRGDLTKAELEHLHISIGINHSMLEDPALFMALGINGLWLWIPKLVMAIITVHAFRGVEYLKKKVSSGRIQQKSR